MSHKRSQKGRLGVIKIDDQVFQLGPIFKQFLIDKKLLQNRKLKSQVLD
jgi:hypothetical protein